jgi:hypothetical protein
MNIIRKNLVIINFLLLISSDQAFSQVLKNLDVAKTTGISVENINISDSIPVFFEKKPLFSFLLNSKKYSSDSVDAVLNGNIYTQLYNNQLSVKFSLNDTIKPGVNGVIIFENTGSDTVTISNVLPFTEDSSSVFITADGPPDLARSPNGSS